MIACGVNELNLFDGNTSTWNIAADLFSNYFTTYVDKPFEDIDQEFKTYSDLS